MFLLFVYLFDKEDPEIVEEWEILECTPNLNWLRRQKYTWFGTSVVVQWLIFCAPNAGGPGSIHVQGTRSRMLLLRVCMPQQKDSVYWNKKWRSCLPQLRPSTATSINILKNQATSLKQNLMGRNRDGDLSPGRVVWKELCRLSQNPLIKFRVGL